MTFHIELPAPPRGNGNTQFFSMDGQPVGFEVVGYLETWLDEADPRGAREQLHERYAHGGGWFSYDGFTLDERNRLLGEGDPPLAPLAQARLRDEVILIYRHAWVAIVQRNRTFEVARID